MKKQETFWASAVVLLLFLLQSAAWGEELTRIHREIQSKGARWQAGETSMTRLSPEERQKRLGFIPPVLTGKEPRLSREAAAAPLAGAPASLDWRNNGGNYVTPVRDQGACGSCWAFAVTAALESSVLINTHTPGVDLDLSEQVVVSCSGGGSCSGGSPMAASNFIRTNGLPLETCYPYTATDGACGNACPNWQGSTYRIAGWAYVTTGQATVNDLKNALHGYGPLPTIFAVYEDFLSYQSGVYHYVTGGRLGLHVVLIVGYDDPGQYFIVKNSWGTGWGESGFFRIAYSELDSVVGFGDYTYALYGGSPLCSYSVSNLNPPTIPAAGGYGSSSVTSAEGCPWTAASNASWIFLTSANIGLGNGAVTFSVIPNTGESRTGTLTIAGQTVTIVQAGGSSSCTYSLNPSQQGFASAGGSGSIGVTAGTGCPWTAQSGASWVSITAGSSGSGTGTVVYNVAPNSSPSPRSAQLTIAGKSFAIIQDGLGCTYSVSPSAQSFSAANGTGAVSVTAPSGCSWTATSNAAWIGISSGSSGSGSGQASYSVGANSGTSSRTGTLTIAGQTFTITQAGRSASCTYSIAPADQKFAFAGGKGSVSVTAGSGCAWKAQSTATWWLTVTSGSSGYGNGTVNYSVDYNTSSSPRSAYLYIGDKYFKVAQDGYGCTYSISPVSQFVPATGATGSVSVTAASGCSWTASSNVSWISLNSGSSGSGSGQVAYTVSANSGTSSRTGTLTIAGKTFTVSQTGGSAPCTYSISPTTQSVPATGATGAVTVNGPGGCNWTAQSNASWISLNSAANGAGTGQVGYTVAANSGTSARTGTLTVAGLTVTISQAGGSNSCFLSVTPTEQKFGPAGGSGRVEVSAASGCTWKAQSYTSWWLSITSGLSGSGSGTVTYSVDLNPSYSPRSTQIAVGDKLVQITQDGQPCTYAISPVSQSVPATGASGAVSVSAASGCNWTAASQVNWIVVYSGGSGAGSGKVYYRVEANSGISSRTGTLTIAGKTFTVTQGPGSGPTGTRSGRR